VFFRFPSQEITELLQKKTYDFPLNPGWLISGSLQTMVSENPHITGARISSQKTLYTLQNHPIEIRNSSSEANGSVYPPNNQDFPVPVTLFIARVLRHQNDIPIDLSQRVTRFLQHAYRAQTSRSVDSEVGGLGNGGWWMVAGKHFWVKPIWPKRSAFLGETNLAKKGAVFLVFNLLK